MVPNYLINSVALVLMILTVTVYSFLSGIILVLVLILTLTSRSIQKTMSNREARGAFQPWSHLLIKEPRKPTSWPAKWASQCLFTIDYANFCHRWNSGIQRKTSKRVLWMVGVISVILWRDLCCYVFPLSWGKTLSKEFILPGEILSVLIWPHLSNGETR